MNKTIKDEPFISWYCDWDYFREHYGKIMDAGYTLWRIGEPHTILEVNLGFEYDVEVQWIKQEALDKEKERHDWEKYAFNCFNKKYETTRN